MLKNQLNEDSTASTPVPYRDTQKILAKPFALPTSKSASHGGVTSTRKRTRVNYAGLGGGADDDDDDDDDDASAGSDDGDGAMGGCKGAGTKNKKKRSSKQPPMAERYKGIGADGTSLKAPIKKYRPVVKSTKSVEELRFQEFAIPIMRDKNGDVVHTEMSLPRLGMGRTREVPPRPLHDPMGEHSIVLFDPTIDDTEAEELLKAKAAAMANGEENVVVLPSATVHKSLSELLGIKPKTDKNLVKVPVVIDPRLGQKLRPHQVSGVKFLYRCATGLVHKDAYGSIMADEMGLGKTLQCITLMWTLLRQSPRPGKGTIEKCIIVCPSSLVRNWVNELKKWLGEVAPNSLALDGKLSKDDMITAVRRWCDVKGRSVTQPVMIVSYETLRGLGDELQGTEVGLLLCDEGHRLKNGDSQTFLALNAINVKRRVILSGTPIQNDLTEYYSLVSFANPSLLGTRQDFHRNFEIKILRGQEADASDQQLEESKAKLAELSGLVNKFMIRRSNELLSKYLPVKFEHVVFCNMSPFQLDLYRLFIRSPEIKKLLRGATSQPLKAINILKKLCNHPDLLDLAVDLEGSEEFFPPGYVPRGRAVQVEHSGKMLVLARFLDSIKRNTKDKIVLISNYTQTLDVFERMCRANRWGHFRLDGTMAVAKRQKLVDRFNDPESPEFIFLLSSKAGGCGLNLIGANRLVLFDPDWNPAADQQALARVWRDGQKKECFVYRFIATGSIEEKIFQRQSHKQSLSSSVVDSAEDVERHFKASDLRELFTFDEKTMCNTHATFKCKRCKDGKQLKKASAVLYGDTSTWNHFDNDGLKDLHDDLLRAESGLPEVSFVFQYCSH